MYSETNELLKQIIAKIGNIEGAVCRKGEPWPCGQGAGRTGGTVEQACRHRAGGTGARTRRHGTGLVGKKGRQTEYMEKQRKVFLCFLAERHELSGLRRVTLARECWAIHRREWDAAAVKGIGYSNYRSLARAKLV